MPSVYKLTKQPAHILLITGRTGTVRHYYYDPVAPFLIHRSIGVTGWSVTHRYTGQAIIQRLPTLETAMSVADEFLRLVPNGSRWVTSWQTSFWEHFQVKFTIHQQWAMAHYILRLKFVYGAM